MLDQLESRFREAVKTFWDARERQLEKQVTAGKIDAGTRGAVTGGTQMGAIEVLLTDILLDAGLGAQHVHARTAVELPGYYRPEKQWDLLVVKDGQLVVAIELKSQVGPSFGNNFNNRAEEAIGNADDIWTAYRQGLLGSFPPPFVGYFFLLEDCNAVHHPLRVREPYFRVDAAFEQSSYAKRYELLCTRLLLERKYSAACLTLSVEGTDQVNFPTRVLSFEQFAASLEAHARALVG